MSVTVEMVKKDMNKAARTRGGEKVKDNTKGLIIIGAIAALAVGYYAYTKLSKPSPSSSYLSGESDLDMAAPLPSDTLH